MGMVPPTTNPFSGSYPNKERTPWSCGRQYAWRPTYENSVSAKATIQNLEKTIKKIDESLQNDLEILAERESKKGGRIQYDKISVFPLKPSRLSPKPMPRSSSFFGDRAKSVAHQINPISASGFADRACSAPPAPPRLQQFLR